MITLSIMILFFIDNPTINTFHALDATLWGKALKRRQEDGDEVGREIGVREGTAEGEKIKQWEEKKGEKGDVKMAERNGRRRKKMRGRG